MDFKMSLLKQKLSTFSHSWKRFRSDNKGNVAIIFGLCGTILIGILGSAFDVNASVKTKQVLQALLDASVLEAVKHDGTQATPPQAPGELERAIAEALLRTKASVSLEDAVTLTEANFNVVNTGAGMLLEADATATTNTFFLSLFTINTIDVTVNAQASVSSQRSPACFLAMHPTSSHTLELHNAVVVDAPGCHIYGNSNHFDDVIDPHSIESFIQVAGGPNGDGSVQTVGGGHHELQNVDILHLNSEVIDNPFPALSGAMPGFPNPPGQNYTIRQWNIEPDRPLLGLHSGNAWAPATKTTYTRTVVMRDDGGNFSAITPGNGRTMTFNRVMLARAHSLNIQSGTTRINQMLSAGVVFVKSGAVLDLSNAELHVDQLVLEPGAQVISTNSIVFLHGNGGPAPCSDGRGSSCEIEAGAGSVLRLSGLRQQNLPISGSGGQDWRGFAIFSAHTPDDYTFAKDFSFIDATIDVEGCVIAPQNYIRWQVTGNQTGVTQHRWTCWLISGVNWRGSGNGPNIVRYNFDINAAGSGTVPPYPSNVVNIVPGVNSSARLLR